MIKQTHLATPRGIDRLMRLISFLLIAFFVVDGKSYKVTNPLKVKSESTLFSSINDHLNGTGDLLRSFISNKTRLSSWR